MNVLTVTCNRDQQQLILQAESIDKFVKKPITHYVIVNEKKCNLMEWHKKLKPYYTKHKLVLLDPLEYSSGYLTLIEDMHDSVGWHTQQLQKLLFAYYIEEDYLILDSKNFFINFIDLNQYAHDSWVANVPVSAFNLDHWMVTAKLYSDFFKTSVIRYYPRINTPFKIHYKYITESKFFTKDTLCDALLYPKTVNASNNNISEFLFYSYLIPKDSYYWNELGTKLHISGQYPGIKSISFNDQPNRDTNQTIQSLIDLLVFSDAGTPILSIHKTMLDKNNLAKYDVDVLELINYILKKLSFNTQLTSHSYYD